LAAIAPIPVAERFARLEADERHRAEAARGFPAPHRLAGLQADYFEALFKLRVKRDAMMSAGSAPGLAKPA